MSITEKQSGPNTSQGGVATRPVCHACASFPRSKACPVCDTTSTTTGVSAEHDLLIKVLRFVERNTHYQFGEPLTPFDAEGGRLMNELQKRLAQPGGAP